MRLLAAIILLSVSASMTAADDAQGYHLLTTAVAQEQRLPAFVCVVDNAIGVGDTNVSSARVWRTLSPSGAVRTRVELAPTTARGKADPGRFTKTFITANGQCWLCYRGKAIAVDPALVPSYGIVDFLVPAQESQHFAVAPSSVRDRVCTRVTQTIVDPKSADIIMRYDIDRELGIIISVTRQDGDAATYAMTRSDLHITPTSAPDELFAPPPTLASGTVTEMERLLDIFTNGIP